MRGVKGYFVCGKYHRANTKHPPEEATPAINRLKEKNPKALITVEDLAEVVEMASQDYQREEHEEEDEPI